MNERIKEIANQAEMETKEYFSFEWDGISKKEYQAFYTKRFSELIIREAAKAAGGIHGYRHVMEHFGIEK